MQTGELEALPALRLGIRDHRAGGPRKKHSTKNSGGDSTTGKNVVGACHTQDLLCIVGPMNLHVVCGRLAEKSTMGAMWFSAAW